MRHILPLSSMLFFFLSFFAFYCCDCITYRYFFLLLLLLLWFHLITHNSAIHILFDVLALYNVFRLLRHTQSAGSKRNPQHPHLVVSLHAQSKWVRTHLWKFPLVLDSKMMGMTALDLGGTTWDSGLLCRSSRQSIWQNSETGAGNVTLTTTANLLHYAQSVVHHYQISFCIRKYQIYTKGMSFLTSVIT